MIVYQVVTVIMLLNMLIAMMAKVRGGLKLTRPAERACHCLASLDLSFELRLFESQRYRPSMMSGTE